MAKYPVSAVSTGDLLREQILLNTEIGQQAASLIAKGDWVGDDIVMGLVNFHLQNMKRKVGLNRYKY